MHYSFNVRAARGVKVVGKLKKRKRVSTDDL